MGTKANAEPAAFNLCLITIDGQKRTASMLITVITNVWAGLFYVIIGFLCN